MPLFRPVFKCWSCGAKLTDGTLLDCEECQAMLQRAGQFARAREYLRYVDLLLNPARTFGAFDHSTDFGDLVAKRIDEMTVRQ